MPKGEKLSPRQLRFVAEYVVEPNATQAAIKAGFSAKSAEVTGFRLLRNPKIASEIEAARIKLEVRTEITADRVLKELALLAFSDVQHYYVGKRGALRVKKAAPRGASRAVASVKHRTIVDADGNKTYEVEFRLWPKPGPLELAGKHVGLFTPAKEEGDAPTTIVVNTHCATPPEVVAEEAEAKGET